MWSAGREDVNVFVGSSRGGLCVPGQAAQWREFGSSSEAIDELLRLAARQPRPWWKPRVRVRVWLSGALARPFPLDPVAGLNDWHELRAFARAAAPEATGLDEPCAIEMEEWPDGRPVLVMAMAEAVLSHLQATAAELELKISSVRPWWAVAFNDVLSAKPDVHTVAVSDVDSVTLLSGTPTGLNSVSCYTPRPSAEQMEKLLSRLDLVREAASLPAMKVRMAGPGEASVFDVPFGAVEALA